LSVLSVTGRFTPWSAVSGRRIGRGGGFYDRLLPQYRAVRAGICFDFQCLEALPAEEHDIRMDLLVTETKILKFATNC